ncbi:MAG TPA: LPS biosynthesis protein WbpP [Elusimicrobia bacterium]|nr:MAG: Vi polysaccharide biosynthesis protein VipB/TviC [Elusimicrobia bacterium RIFOXYA12_FULL_49_49]OGS10809.1 MAG: Vi polysaccharide biosynthesis protein VipB/TviC [Elusimicrobia bacterium RIFOXYB1_FULL_48_9]OGS16826.1 MAG: Vi polysaccharide biosynthesis protein VipB/TviC [Elusimicrobia bacterium RIFOXYA2_FULL_47_53]OGS32054.1 MAG: Vi polysaccharide biosynthesis protein VipB/TviC [Elusimicrobia bacterium RIFOXYB2_FULL_46_23]HBU69947.1 LPS biosynthesis protein WbpP [Elusimicrobiota bacterium
MRYLVTGGAGFIGSNIAKELLKRKHYVRIIDNLSTGKLSHLNGVLSKVDFVEGDIRKEKDLQKALKGIDFVLHQAALRSVPRSVDDPLSSNDVNITGSLKLLIAARQAGVKRLVYASSSSVYGDIKTIPQRESQPTGPISPYATSKLGAENYCRVFAKTFGFETVSLRYFNVFGPNQDPESKYAAVIPKFIESAFDGTTVEIHGDGNQSRDFTYIDNVVSANILASTAKGVSGEVFNIACNETHSVNDIARAVEKITGLKLKAVHTKPRAGDVRRTCADISKAGKLLKYKPLVSFEEGMKRTINWFKENN